MASGTSDPMDTETEPSTSAPKKHDGRAVYYRFKHNNIWAPEPTEDDVNSVTAQLGGVRVDDGTRMVRMGDGDRIIFDRGPESYDIDINMLKKYRNKGRGAECQGRRGRGLECQGRRGRGVECQGRGGGRGIRRRSEKEEGEVWSDEDGNESDSSISSGGLSDGAKELLRRRRGSPRKRKASKNHEKCIWNPEDLHDIVPDTEFSIRIAKGLQEKNHDVVEALVKIIGRPAIEAVFRKTMKIERLGGLMVKDGSRRRTPGGVFFNLIQNNPKINSAAVKKILQRPKLKAVRKKTQGGLGTRLDIKLNHQ